MLRFKFVQDGEFCDPIYKVIHENGDSIGELVLDNGLWYGELYSSCGHRIFSEISEKIKELNEATKQQRILGVFKMDINDLTLKQIKELSALVGTKQNESTGLNCMIGKKVIIRTYSAGNWFGELNQKDGSEVILLNAIRLWRWFAKDGVSLSGVATFGIDASKSKIEKAVDSVWLEAIEIIPCSEKSIKNIEEAANAKA